MASILFNFISLALLLACTLAAPATYEQALLANRHASTASNLQLDPAPNTVGVYLPNKLHKGSSDEDTFWLPIGKRVYTRDNPMLPTHPGFGRLINVIAGPSRRAELDQIVCKLYPAVDQKKFLTPTGLRRDPMSVPIRLRKRDALVDFGEPDKAWNLYGREVGSYECS